MSNKVQMKKGVLWSAPNTAIHGKEGRYGSVGVDIKALVNRSTDGARVSKYLKSGWDWGKFTPVTVAVFPDGRQHLLDGDHRKHMYAEVFPQMNTIPAYFIEVENEEEYHKLFYHVNWASRKNATKEEVFVHQVFAKESAALKIEANLTDCGVSVIGSPDKGGTVGDVSGPAVTVGAFNRAVKRGVANTKNSISLMRVAWPDTVKLQGELLEGIAILYKLYPELSNGSKVATDFSIWFERAAGMRNQKDVASDYKTKGGRVHHRHAESIARGLISEWRGTELRNGCSKQWKQKKISIRKINNLFS